MLYFSDALGAEKYRTETVLGAFPPGKVML
jgi:hypothetical protein